MPLFTKDFRCKPPSSCSEQMFVFHRFLSEGNLKFVCVSTGCIDDGVDWWDRETSKCDIFRCSRQFPT